MNLAYWLNLKDNLLLLAETREEFDGFMALAARFHYQIGIVSDRFPLLASLTVLENIALMAMYHRNLSLSRVEAQVEPEFAALGMTAAAGKRLEHLSREEVLQTYLLRCLAKNNIIVLMNTPAASEIELILDSLARLGKKLRLWIACLAGDAETYRRFPLRTITVGGAA